MFAGLLDPVLVLTVKQLSLSTGGICFSLFSRTFTTQEPHKVCPSHILTEPPLSPCILPLCVVSLTASNFFKAALKKNLSAAHVREDLVQLGLSEGKAEWVCAQWKTNFLAMSRVAASQSLTVNQLVDMEWRFGGET